MLTMWPVTGSGKSDQTSAPLRLEILATLGRGTQSVKINKIKGFIYKVHKDTNFQVRRVKQKKKSWKKKKKKKNRKMEKMNGRQDRFFFSKWIWSDGS